MTKIPTQMDSTTFTNGEEIKVNVQFEPNVLAQFCYYKGIDISGYIDFDKSGKTHLVELIKEMAKLLVEVGEDYRDSRK